MQMPNIVTEMKDKQVQKEDGPSMEKINTDKIILAYFDIQAYSSFISNNSKEGCIKKTKDLLDIVKKDLRSFILNIKVKHWILSDSIIIIPDIENRPLDISTIDFLVTMSSGLMFRGAWAGLPLRGALGAGYFYKDNDIIISSALVDAATYEKEQNWYGAVITPTALTLIREIYPSFENEYKTLLNFERFLDKGKIPWTDSKHKHGKAIHKPEHSFYIKPAMPLTDWRKYLPDYIEINKKVEASDFLYGA